LDGSSLALNAKDTFKSKPMHISLFKRAAVICASALAVASPAAYSQEWTSFKVGQIAEFSYSFSHAHLPDGRFVFGTDGQVFIQDSYGTAAMTALENTEEVTMDPAFMAVRSETQALVGAGGYSGPSGVYLFDPSAPATSLVTPPLATLQNYSGVFWKHPTSGREGWLISGGNGVEGASDLTFISTDGVVKGSVTGPLSAYSGSVATNGGGDVFVSLAGLFGSVENNQVIKFTAAQMDAAVEAIVDESPAPLTRGEAELVFTADDSGAMTVDAEGRIWVGGYQINHLQAYDPATGANRRFMPDHAPLAGAFGPPMYSPKVFTKDAVDYVSFLANDGYFVSNSDLVLGYRPVSELVVRDVQITTASAMINEGDAETVTVTVQMTPAAAESITVPLNVSGTATAGEDFNLAVNEVVFAAGETTKTFNINVLDDAVREEGKERLVVTLGNPVPLAQAGLGAMGTEIFTLTIEDNDTRAVIATEQNFATLRVGSTFDHGIITSGGVATRWSAKGLPPGMKINADGTLTGTPTKAGEYDQVVITATNEFGVSTSVTFLLNVEPFPAGATGTFTGLVDRAGTATGGLGARVTLTTTAKSSYTGKVVIGKKTYAIKGLLDAGSGNAEGAAVLKTAAPQELAFVINPGNGLLSGTLQGGGVLAGWRGQVATDRTGVYNFRASTVATPADDVPQGATFGAMKLSTKAVAKVVGKMADGSNFTASSPLGLNGDVVIYQALYTTPGTFTGTVTLADNLAHAITGDLTWSKPAQAKGPLYKEGWETPLALTALGGKYRAPAGATLPLDATPSEEDNALLVLQDGGIETVGSADNPVTFGVQVLSANKLVMEAPQKIKVASKTGAMSGTVTLGEGPARKVVKFQGLLVPDAATENAFDAEGFGFFILPTGTAGVSRAGAVLLERLDEA
jgi:hypothetical protein